MSKLKVTFIGFMFPLVLLFGSPQVDSRNPDTKNNNNGYAQSGTLQKMIVENASVTMQLDLNGLNGSNSLVARPVTLHFAASPNSFFPVLVFNDLLRGLRARLDGTGLAKLLFRHSLYSYAALNSSLKRLVSKNFRRTKVSILPFATAIHEFTFFNVEGHQYNYDANAQSLSITGGRLLVSKQFANALGRPSDAGSIDWNNFHRRGDATGRDRPDC